jgi:hypothetical protein
MHLYQLHPIPLSFKSEEERHIREASPLLGSLRGGEAYTFGISHRCRESGEVNIYGISHRCHEGGEVNIYGISHRCHEGGGREKITSEGGLGPGC